MMAGRLAAASSYSVSVGAAALMAYPIYGSQQLLVAISVTMLAGVALATAAMLRRWGPLLQLAATLGVLIAIAVPLAAPASLRGGFPSWENLGTVYAAIWTSWRRLTTIDLPVGTDDGLLMPVVMLVLVAMVLGLGLILRTQKGEVAALMPIMIMIWALLWGTPTPSPIWQPMLLAAASVAHVTILRQARRRRRAERTTSSLPRRFSAGLLAIVLAVLIGAGSALSTQLGDRVVLRESPREPTTVLAETSPLASFRSNFDDDSRGAVMMTVSGLAVDDRVRIAVLDQYNGEVFTAGVAGLVRTSGRAPVSSDSRQIGVSIENYDGVWIPAVGDVRSVTFVGPRASDLSQSLLTDRGGDLIASTAGLTQGDGYSMMVGSPAATVDAVQSLEPAAYDGDSFQLPVSALSWLAAKTRGTNSQGEALASVVYGLRDEGYLSHGLEESEAASRPGHSSSRLETLFSADHLVGDQEQFAAAAALMARELGFPSRVVVGYLPNEGGTAAIRGSDASAWIEVATTDGWIAIDVVPGNKGVPEERESSSHPDQQPLPPVPPQLPEGGQPDANEQGLKTNPVQPPHDEGDNRLWLRWLLVIGGLLVVLALPFVIIVLVKTLRSRYRRHVGDPQRRALGAWRDFVDLAIDRGRELEGDRTRQEYAGDDPDVLEFAVQVDAAVFGREPIDEAVIEDLWRRRGSILGDIDAERSWFDRLVARLTLRSLAPALFGVSAADTQESALHRREASTAGATG